MESPWQPGAETPRQYGSVFTPTNNYGSMSDAATPMTPNPTPTPGGYGGQTPEPSTPMTPHTPVTPGAGLGGEGTSAAFEAALGTKGIEAYYNNEIGVVEGKVKPGHVSIDIGGKVNGCWNSGDLSSFEVILSCCFAVLCVGSGVSC